MLNLGSLSFEERPFLGRYLGSFEFRAMMLVGNVCSSCCKGEALAYRLPSVKLLSSVFSLVSVAVYQYCSVCPPPSR